MRAPRWFRQMQARRAFRRFVNSQSGGILVVDVRPGGDAEITEVFVADRKRTMIQFCPPIKTTLAKLFS